MVRRLLLTILVLGVCTATAHAGVFVGASVGDAKLSVDDSGFSFDESDFAYKIYGGFTFIKFFAVEASYVDLGSPKDTVSPGVDATIDITAWDVYGVGILPLGKHIEIFGKAGFVFWDSKTKFSGALTGSGSESDSDTAYGAGINFKLGDHIGIRAEYEVFDVSDVDTLDMASVGVNIRF